MIVIAVTIKREHNIIDYTAKQTAKLASEKLIFYIQKAIYVEWWKCGKNLCILNSSTSYCIHMKHIIHFQIIVYPKHTSNIMHDMNNKPQLTLANKIHFSGGFQSLLFPYNENSYVIMKTGYSIIIKILNGFITNIRNGILIVIWLTIKFYSHFPIMQSTKKKVYNLISRPICICIIYMFIDRIVLRCIKKRWQNKQAMETTTKKKKSWIFDE